MAWFCPDDLSGVQVSRVFIGLLRPARPFPRDALVDRDTVTRGGRGTAVVAVGVGKKREKEKAARVLQTAMIWETKVAC